MAANELPSRPSYHANMPRKKTNLPRQAAQPDWFLQEWMADLHVSQAKLADECDWNRSTMHGIYHGRTAYYREIVNLVSLKLNIQPYELLMPPQQAMALRRLREDALRVVEDTRELARTGTEG